MVSMSPDAVLAGCAGLLGLAIGSFVNVVIYRVPVGESIVSPPSKCPSCHAPIRNRHNIPLLGWVALRGQCYDCQVAISPRYPIVEAVTGIAFALVAARLLGLNQPWAVAAYLYFAAAGIALTMIDLDHKRLPNAIVLPSYPILAALLAIAAAGQHDWSALGRAGLGAAALFAFYYAAAIAYPAGMGFGDVKLAGIIGGVLAYLSWSTWIVGAFGGFLLGAVGGVAVMAVGRGGRKTAIPFGPFMILAALLALFVGPTVTDTYLRLVHHT